jgi:Tfp pilus assembly protein PilN
MIRINLLPVRQAKQRQFGKQQILFGFVALLVEAAALFYVYQIKQTELEGYVSDADAIDAEVKTLEKDNEVITQLNQQRQQLQNLARVLEDLEANRAGPVQVLDELKIMLNAPANDLDRAQQERRGWSTAWTPTNIWLSSFEEKGGKLDITGSAKSNDDIAEFNARLASSVYFSKVRLNFTNLDNNPRLGKVYSFSISASVNYGIVSGEKEQG